MILYKLLPGQWGWIKNLRQSFNSLPGAVLSIMLITAGTIYILIGIFVQNIYVKAGATAYAVLP